MERKKKKPSEKPSKPPGRAPPYRCRPRPRAATVPASAPRTVADSGRARPGPPLPRRAPPSAETAPAPPPRAAARRHRARRRAAAALPISRAKTRAVHTHPVAVGM
jgi:hypothetical protein